MECSTLNKSVRTVELVTLPPASELAETIEREIAEGDIADLRITCAPALYPETCALSMFGYAIKPDHGLASNVLKTILVRPSGDEEQISFVIGPAVLRDPSPAAPAFSAVIKQQYKWRSELAMPGVDAQSVGERLEKIRQDHGAVTPELIVEDAKDPDAPTHGCFEWNDKRAGALWRLAQARIIVTEIVVEVQSEHAREPIEVTAFTTADGPVIPQSEPECHVYSTSPGLTSAEEPHFRRRLLRRALKDLKRFCAQYQELEELKPLIIEIQNTKERLSQSL